MKICTLFLSAFLYFNTYAQTNFSVLVQPYAIPQLPGLHSYAAAQYNGKWIIVGGRTDGLHLRQPFNSFPSSSNNTNIYVVDPATKNVWSTSVNTLSATLKEQLQSTNMNFCYDNTKFYIAGGYGFSATNNNHITYASLIVIEMQGLVNAVINNTAINTHFRQLNNNLFAITGGQMAKLGDMFIMVGGHKFDGRYNPNSGGSFTQSYINQIRKFKLIDDGINISIGYQNSITDAAELHRRDYNMVPQVFPNGKLGYTVFSGVFQVAANLPYLNSVDIDTIGYTPNSTFTQQLNHYHSGKLGIYDATANQMHSIFFGGMAQYYFDAGGNLIQDDNVPFVSTIGRVTRKANGDMVETKMGDLNGFIGSGAEMFVNHSLPHYANEVIQLNNIAQDTILAGYLVGGIESSAANIFNINTGTQSNASNAVYKVLLVKSTTLPVILVSFNGKKQKNEIVLNWKTSTETNHRLFEVEKSIDGQSFTTISSIQGSGNSIQNHSYTVTDFSPYKGINYYRLKMVSESGSYSYSTIILITFNESNNGFLLYPNPVDEKLMVEFTENINGVANLKIIDFFGKIITEESIKIRGKQLALNVHQLNKGTYVLQIEIETKKYTSRFLKK
jgi:hypothetical protein